MLSGWVGKRLQQAGCFLGPGLIDRHGDLATLASLPDGPGLSRAQVLLAATARRPDGERLAFPLRDRLWWTSRWVRGPSTADGLELFPPPAHGPCTQLLREYLEEFWRTWSFLSERVEQLHEGGK